MGYLLMASWYAGLRCDWRVWAQREKSLLDSMTADVHTDLYLLLIKTLTL